MAQERNEMEHRAACDVAVQSLKNELQLATCLLRHIKEARETMAVEDEAVDSARNAFRHAVEALQRMPKLEIEDMNAVQQLMDEFRSALAQLGV
jgi:hypothetical protein